MANFLFILGIVLLFFLPGAGLVCVFVALVIDAMEEAQRP